MCFFHKSIGQCCYTMHQMAALCYDRILIEDENVVLTRTNWLKRCGLLDFSTYC